LKSIIFMSRIRRTDKRLAGAASCDGAKEDPERGGALGVGGVGRKPGKKPLGGFELIPRGMLVG
jgi:hypothetical protein